MTLLPHKECRNEQFTSRHAHGFKGSIQLPIVFEIELIDDDHWGDSKSSESIIIWVRTSYQISRACDGAIPPSSAFTSDQSCPGQERGNNDEHTKSESAPLAVIYRMPHDGFYHRLKISLTHSQPLARHLKYNSYFKFLDDPSASQGVPK